LANVYGLAWIDEHRGPHGKPVTGFQAFVERRDFKPGTILHRYYLYSPELTSLVQAVPSELVTIVRDPYDLFVSYYYHLQRFPTAFERNGSHASVMIGKALGDPDVLTYLASDFGSLLRRADAWLTSGQSLVARYEDLHRDTAAEVARIASVIRPVDRAAIERAVSACGVEEMR